MCVQCAVYRKCKAESMVENVKQKCKAYLPGSPVTSYSVPAPVGGRAHVVVEGNEADASLVIVSYL